MSIDDARDKIRELISENAALRTRIQRLEEALRDIAGISHSGHRIAEEALATVEGVARSAALENSEADSEVSGDTDAP